MLESAGKQYSFTWEDIDVMSVMGKTALGARRGEPLLYVLELAPLAPRKRVLQLEMDVMELHGGCVITPQGRFSFPSMTPAPPPAEDDPGCSYRDVMYGVTEGGGAWQVDTLPNRNRARRLLTPLWPDWLVESVVAHIQS